VMKTIVYDVTASPFGWKQPAGSANMPYSPSVTHEAAARN
jgi:hypothetical protein